MSEKHPWNDLGNYLDVALRVVEDHPFVIDHNLGFPEAPSPEAGEISGDVFCHGEVILRVHKHFVIRAEGKRQYARTVKYSYHARYDNGEDILRYDNAHQYRSHPTPHHKHEYSDEETVVHVGETWPYLSEVLDELQKVIWGD